MNIKPPHHDRLRDYDALHVQQLWEDAIELDVDLSACDPYRALNNDKYKIAIGQATKVISAARRKRDAHFRKEDMYAINRQAFRASTYAEQKVLESLMRFESRMMQLHHDVCSLCNECSIDMTVNKNNVKIATVFRSRQCTL